jgi:hypothetical protein
MGGSDGKLGECSTEFAPILDFLAQCSMKPESPRLVPLRKPVNTNFKLVESVHLSW